VNDLISPFAPICADYAKKFDEADIAHDIEMTKTLLEGAKAVISVHDEPAYAHLFYSVGTSLTILYSLTKLNSKPMLHLDPPIFP